MSDMAKLDKQLAEMIRSQSGKAQELSAQAKAAVEDVNRSAEAVRNFKFDTTQIEAAVKTVNAANPMK